MIATDDDETVKIWTLPSESGTQLSGTLQDVKRSASSQRLPVEGVAHRISRRLCAQHRYRRKFDRHTWDTPCSNFSPRFSAQGGQNLAP